MRQKAYEKDLALSYHPFLPILGTGLVTSDGDLWQKQRLLIGPALRVEILDDIVGIAHRAVNRQANLFTFELSSEKLKWSFCNPPQRDRQRFNSFLAAFAAPSM